MDCPCRQRLHLHQGFMLPSSHRSVFLLRPLALLRRQRPTNDESNKRCVTRCFGKLALFVVEKTFRRLEESDPKIKVNRKGKRSDLESTFYLDVIDGDPNCIRSVEFAVIGRRCHPGKFKTYYPYKFFLESEQRYVYRFASPHIVTPVMVHCRAIVRSPEGTEQQVRIPRELENYRGGGEGNKERIEMFVEPQKMRRGIDPVPLPIATLYGVDMELGLTDNAVKDTDEDDIYEYLELAKHEVFTADIRDCHDDKGDHQKEQTPSRWILTVADLLQDKNLMEVVKMVKKIRSDDSFVQIDNTMRFYVNVHVSEVSLEGLIRICQNFVQFEPAIDAILYPVPDISDEKSDDDNDNADATVIYKSNREAIQGRTNKDRLDILARCQSMQELCDIMNPSNDDDDTEHRCNFKLNVQGLLAVKDEDDWRTKPKTIEFRQHYGTSDLDEVANWIRFCLQFVNHSIQQTIPTSSMPRSKIDDSLGIRDQIDQLFNDVVQDRYLAAFYKEVVDDDDDDDEQLEKEEDYDSELDELEREFARASSTKYEIEKRIKARMTNRRAARTKQQQLTKNARLSF